MHKIILPSWAVMMGEPLEKVFFFVPWGHCSVFFFIIKIAPPGCPKTVTEKTRVPRPWKEHLQPKRLHLRGDTRTLKIFENFKNKKF